MNPFFLGPDVKLMRETAAEREERLEHQGGSLVTASPLALQLGRLLIRMGSKLAHEDPIHAQPRHVIS